MSNTERSGSFQRLRKLVCVQVGGGPICKVCNEKRWRPINCKSLFKKKKKKGHSVHLSSVNDDIQAVWVRSVWACRMVWPLWPTAARVCVLHMWILCMTMFSVSTFFLFIFFPLTRWGWEMSSCSVCSYLSETISLSLFLGGWTIFQPPRKNPRHNN